MKIEKYTIQILLFCAALLTTLWNYQFGQMDHVEHLPIIFRAESSEYLKNDSFLNAFSQNYDPRFYYTRLILLLKSVFPLPLLFFLLTYFTNYLIALASFRIAGQLFSKEIICGLISVFLVLTVPTIELGSVSEIHTDYLTPNAMAFSLILLAMSFIFSREWILAGSILGLASLIHPLAGPECGIILFFCAALEQIYSNKLKFKKYLSFVSGGIVFLLFATLSLAPFFLNKSDGLDSNTFIDIYAHFRVPHHILPSVFMHPEERNLAIKLLILLFFLWIAYYVTVKSRKLQSYILILSAVLVLLAIAGYVFVECYPLKIVVIAQTFRLLYLLKFLLLLLLGAFIGHNFHWGTQLNKVYAFAILISSFALPNLLWIFAFWGFRSLVNRRLNLPQLALFIEIILVLALGVYGFYLSWLNIEHSSDVYLWTFMLLGFPILSILKLSGIQRIALPLTTLFFFAFWSMNPRHEPHTPLQKAISRQYNLSDLPATQLEIAKKIKELTPNDAVLLVPPMFGELRYMANRALVVTFKTLPFGGKEMIDWKNRVFDCYGWTDLKGFNAVLYSFEPNYKTIDTERLKMLSFKYKTDYAVLYKETEVIFPVLYENSQFKLVYIGKPES